MAGRPPLTDGERAERITITLPSDLLEFAKEYSLRETMDKPNVSLAVRDALEAMRERTE